MGGVLDKLVAGVTGKLQELGNPVADLGTKFYFEQLTFEITRKCNLKCAHCLRGKMQPISMPLEVIDKVLESCSGIRSIFLTGGEPFLEPDIIEHLVDKVISMNFDTEEISVITNGTILNERGERCAKAFDRFSKWRISKGAASPKAHIEISNDDFHGNDSENAAGFYKNCTSDVEITVQEYRKPEDISPFGRAVENNLTNKKRYEAVYPHRIRVDAGNRIPCRLDITAKGNLTYPEMNEWEEVDSVSIGNIMKESLECMIERNQWEELRCCEIKYLNNYKKGISDTEAGTNEHKLLEWCVEMYEQIRTLRIRIHRQLPYIDYPTICLLADISTVVMTGSKLWLSIVGYDDGFINMVNEEYAEHFWKICNENNAYFWMSGKPKERQIPYDVNQIHIDNCGDTLEKEIKRLQGETE